MLIDSDEETFHYLRTDICAIRKILNRYLSELFQFFPISVEIECEYSTTIWISLNHCDVFYFIHGTPWCAGNKVMKTN